MEHALAQIGLIENEMQDYYYQRSEAWQDGDKGADFLQKLEELQQVRDMAADWLD